MATNMVASAVPGRIRIKTPALHRPAPLARMEEAVQKLDGIISIRPNRLAGSMTVTYDCSRIAAGEMEAQVARLAANMAGDPIPAPASKPHRRNIHLRRRANRMAKYGSIASLGVSLAALGAGAKHLHAISGGLFVAFLAVHMGVHRKYTFR